MSRPNHKWEKLGGNTININCDAAGCMSSAQAGISVLARDDEKKIKEVLNRATRGNNVDMMEALAILEGLRLSKQNGWTDIVIESDAEIVIH